MRNRLLIIDDHDHLRKMVKDFLDSQDLNLEIFEASTGEMGLTKASCVKPDIILLDINLPHANGFQTFRELRIDVPNSSIIILTMFEVDVFKKVTKEINADDFIGKSEVYERLVPSIKRCLSERKQRYVKNTK